MFNLSNAFPIKWNIIWDGIISLQNQHINNQQLYWEELYKTDKWTFIRELQKFTKKKIFYFRVVMSQNKQSYFL